MTTNERTVGRYLVWVLAALSLGAGVIHFAVSGQHYEVSWAHGTFFAVVAWLQVSWAVGVVLRPYRRLLAAGVLLNAGIIGVWAISRVWGVPIGPGAWTPEKVTLADALSSGFEAGIVILSLAVLVRPALAQQQLRPALAVPGVGIAAVGVAVISSMAVAPAFASGHSHGTSASGDGHSHGTTSAAGAHAGHAAIVSNAPVGNTPCEQSGPPASAGQISSAGGHGHRGPVAWQPIADRATRDELGAQLDVAHQVTLQYPTVADAEADGYHMVTGYVPCIGAHYIKTSNFRGFDPAKPSMLLYDGTNPDSKIVGLSYAMLGDPDKPPDGFAGPNDPWHKHDSNGGLCMKDGVVVGAESTSEAQCQARGGSKVALHNLWMMHAWTADSWQSSWGIFSAENPDLGGVIGDINGTPTAASRKQLGGTATKD